MENLIIIALITALLLSLLCGCVSSPATQAGTTEPSQEPTTPAPSATAVIKVENTAFNTVNPELFGDNTSYRGEGYGLWDVVTNAPEETLLEMLKNSGVTHIRYPGGIEGEYYHWYEIVGTDRVAQIDPFSKEFPSFETHTGVPYDVIFGIDEFVELCKQAGMQPTLQINAGTGTAQEAADLVKYCLDNNIDATFFAVGNELYSYDNSVAGVNIQKTPQEYVRFYLDCYEKIREVSDTVRVGAVGVPRNAVICRDPSWNATVLSSLADKMDFYDVHIAYAPMAATPDLKVLKGNYLSGSVWVQAQLDQLLADMAQYTGEYYDDIDIYISEWGTLLGGHYDNSMAGTVYIATIFNLMLNEPKITAANHLPLLNHPINCNLLGYEENGGVKTYWQNAVSYIFRWYSEMQNRSVLTTTIESPTFDTAAGTLQPAAQNVGSIDAVTFLDETNKRGTLIITNRDPEQDIAVTLDLPFDNVTITDVKEVWHADPMTYNSAQNPDAIKEVTLSTDSVYSTENGLTINTKSVSVIRIDFIYN